MECLYGVSGLLCGTLPPKNSCQKSICIPRFSGASFKTIVPYELHKCYECKVGDVISQILISKT